MSRWARIFGGLCVASYCLAPINAYAAAPVTADADLNRIEKTLQEEKKRHTQLKKQADVLASDIRAVKAKMIKAATTVRKHERKLISLERKLGTLEVQEHALKKVIDRRGDQMVTVIAALQRLAWRPTEALIAQPTPPSDTVRSAILLRSAVPQIEASAKELKVDLDKLSLLQKQVLGQKTRIAAVTKDLAKTHKEMKVLFGHKATIQREKTAASKQAEKRIRSLAAKASDLKDLIAKLKAEQVRQREEARKRAVLEAKKQRAAELAHRARLAKLKREKKEAAAKEEQRKENLRLAKIKADKAAKKRQMAQRPPPQNFSKARGRLPMPAIGRLVQKYGKKTKAGTHAKGISIRTRASAQVITPFDGVVLFSGPFRGYGQLLIIEYGGGYHILLAGMSKIDASTGQSLLAGEPVGVMTSQSSPELYVELRHGGQPINPLPWLTASKNKGQG